MKTNCRIGRVKLKRGGNLHLLPLKPKPFSFSAVENLSKMIDDQTLAVGFFVMKKDRNITTGSALDEGTTINDVYGACDLLKQDIEDTWDAPLTPYDAA